MPRIDVDQDVIEYLRSKVQDFGETPNSVLRRQLGLVEKREVVTPHVSPRRSVGTADTPTLTSFGAPEALRQILRVVWLVRAGGLERVAATLRAAEEFGVERTTIADKYARQLSLDVAQFDRLLTQADLSDLRRTLTTTFPDHRVDVGSAIDRVLESEKG